MEALIEYSKKAQDDIELFYNSLEMNPSKIVIINAVILFEKLLKQGLARCYGYRKSELNESFSVLIQIAEIKFRNAYNREHWQLLKTISRMRNHVAHKQTSSIPFGDIIHSYMRHVFPKEILNANFMLLLQPQSVELWKILIKLVYTFVSVEVNTKIMLKENPNIASKLMTIITQFIESEEGQAITKMCEEAVRQAEHEEVQSSTNLA